MPSRRFRRKYQSGGIIPDFTGAQVLGQPQRIEQRVNPIDFNANPAFQAVSARQDSLRTAISQADFSRRERMDAWRVEELNREFLDTRLSQLQESMAIGQDQLTKLDMNIPEQARLAQEIRGRIDDINEQSAAILTDNSLTPSERGQRLQEKILETQKLFNSQEYIRHMQNNQLAADVYNGVSKVASDGETLIDFGAANDNLNLARSLQMGEIDRSTFFNKRKNFTLDPKSVDRWEQKVSDYVRDSLDPDKAATNWEQYKGDDDFLIFQEKFAVPDLESQVDTLYEMYKNNTQWLKVQEARGNRAFLGEDGLVDDDLLRNYARRQIKLIRGSLGAQGKEIAVDVDIQRRPSNRRGGGGGGGRSLTQSERRDAAMKNTIEAQGYEVVDPTILRQLNSASEAIRFLQTPVDQLPPEDQPFARDLRMAIRVPSPQSQGEEGVAQNLSPEQVAEERRNQELIEQEQAEPFSGENIIYDRNIENLQSAKEQLEENNIFDDNIEAQKEPIDREINLNEELKDKVLNAYSTLEDLSAGGDVVINIGQDRFIPGRTASRTEKSEVRVEKADGGEDSPYRLKLIGTRGFLLRGARLNKQELSAFVQMAAGMNRKQMRSVTYESLLEFMGSGLGPVNQQEAPTQRKSATSNGEGEVINKYY